MVEPQNAPWEFRVGGEKKAVDTFDIWTLGPLDATG